MLPFELGVILLAGSVVLAPQSAHAGLAGMQRVATGLSSPMFTTFAPGDPTRLYIAERGTPFNSSNATASIRILDLTTGTLEPTPFLSISGLNNNGEGGFLGLAFHPDYQSNGKFYTYVTANDSVAGTPFSSYIRQYTRSAEDPDRANPDFTPVISWTQPQDNHNGGWIGFSPRDNYLYIMSGDGGNGNDQGTGHTEPGGNAQDITSNFLGKTLRIDVEGDDFPSDPNRNYRIPTNSLVGDQVIPGNPFAPQEPGGMDHVGDDEIWAYGLRNPFRAGFDRATGDLWIGDVGQGAREEIDFQSGESNGGENYGWRLREGFIQTPGSVGGAKPADNVDPIYDYLRPGAPGSNSDFTGRTVTGGVPYRGPDPTLQGVYFFADYVDNKVWTLTRDPNGGGPDVDRVNSLLAPNVGSPSGPVAISEDSVGNLYITYLNSGSVYRVVTDQFTAGDFNGDASVDEQDVAIWSDNFGLEGDGTRTTGDANGDGNVDGADFLAWQLNFGWSPANVANRTDSLDAVPEPQSLLLVIFAAAATIRQPNRRTGASVT